MNIIKFIYLISIIYYKINQFNIKKKYNKNNNTNLDK